MTGQGRMSVGVEEGRCWWMSGPGMMSERMRSEGGSERAKMDVCWLVSW